MQKGEHCPADCECRERERTIRALVENHNDDTGYYSDSSHLKDRWATMLVGQITKLFAALPSTERPNTETEERQG
jgi:hypothetical protein